MSPRARVKPVGFKARIIAAYQRHQMDQNLIAKLENEIRELERANKMLHDEIQVLKQPIKTYPFEMPDSMILPKEPPIELFKQEEVKETKEGT